MQDDRGDLNRVAGDVADGTAVDWEALGAQSPKMKRVLTRLQEIARIASWHQSRQPQVAPTTDMTPTTRTIQSESSPERIETPVPSRWGPLEIIERIGGGGYGVVFRAHDPNLNRDVALKLFHERENDRDPGGWRSLGEARRLARVRHENVLVIHGADRHDGRIGLWTDLIEGRTLEQHLDREGVFGADEATVIGIDLCRALAAVHAAGLVHRDVKTSNVMREEGGRIVLMDFNSTTEKPTLEGRSRSGPVSGTPLFMAPEIFLGREADASSDIYSLGVVLYRLVSGKYPVPSTRLSELYEKHKRGEMVPLRDVRPDLPAAFVQVVERALSSDPQRRYPSVGVMEHALATLMAPAADENNREPTSFWQRPAFSALMTVLAIAAMIIFDLLGPGSGGPLDVQASLYRAREASDEQLRPGGRIAPGDRLFLEIEGNQEMHVYVLSEDRSGQAFVLFPLPGLDLENPIHAGALQRLPGTASGQVHFWEVTSARGSEGFFVIASRQRLSDLERALAAIPRAGSERPSQDLERTRAFRRGIGGVVPDQPPGEVLSISPLAAIMRDLSRRARTDDGLWFWNLQLQNLGR